MAEFSSSCGGGSGGGGGGGGSSSSSSSSSSSAAYETLLFWYERKYIKKHTLPYLHLLLKLLYIFIDSVDFQAITYTIT